MAYFLSCDSQHNIFKWDTWYIIIFLSRSFKNKFSNTHLSRFIVQYWRMWLIIFFIKSIAAGFCTAISEKFLTSQVWNLSVLNSSVLLLLQMTSLFLLASGNVTPIWYFQVGQWYIIVVVPFDKNRLGSRDSK